MKKILVADALDKEAMDRLKAIPAFAVTVKTGMDEAELVRTIPGFNAIVVRGATKVTRKVIEAATDLELILRAGIGLDNVDAAAAKEKGIAVANTPAATTISVAELTMGLMLSAVRQLGRANLSMKQHKWEKKTLSGTELYGKTLGLLGAGLIGTEVARRAAAFGMRVVAHDHYISNHALADMVEDDDELFALADYISIHLPLTPETKGMLDRNAFAKMKDGVVIVNTARGKVVVEEDLAEALKSGKVRAYATDVYYSDPPEPSSPLLTAPNVVMTPHIGGSSKENLLRIGDNVVDILKKWKR